MGCGKPEALPEIARWMKDGSFAGATLFLTATTAMARIMISSNAMQGSFSASETADFKSVLDLPDPAL